VHLSCQLFHCPADEGLALKAHIGLHFCPVPLALCLLAKSHPLRLAARGADASAEDERRKCQSRGNSHVIRKKRSSGAPSQPRRSGNADRARNINGISIPIEGTVGQYFIVPSELVDAGQGLSVSPNPAIRSRPFKLSQGDCRPPCRRHPNVAVSSAVGRPRQWSTQEEMRRHNRRVHSPDLCCRFGQFFILPRPGDRELSTFVGHTACENVVVRLESGK
jgi:hypothetical protein